MQEWRRQALGQVPLLKRYFRRADDPMALWIELQTDLWRLCRDEYRLYGCGSLNREAIRQVWGYARWCYFRSGDREVREAVACAFYEHLPLDEGVRRTLPFHLSGADFESLEDVFRYHLDTDAEYDRFRDEFYQTKASLAALAPTHDLRVLRHLVTSTLASPKTDTNLNTGPKPYHWTVDAYYRAGEAGVFERDIKLELIRGKVIDRFTEGGPAEYRWTADAFDRACDVGVFGSEARLELIHGRIMDRMGQGPLHSILVTLIAERLRAVLSPRLLVREEKPIRIAFDGEPVMDIMVVNRTVLDAPPYYAANQVTPEDIHLAIELAVSSAKSDLGDKALLYAQAGLGDYWVVLPEEGAVLVHRDPTPQGYGSIVSMDGNETIWPLAAPEAVLPVRDLLGLTG